MTVKDAVCLRCDWAGRERGPVCPNCGERLFRAATPPRSKTRKERGSGKDRRSEDESGRGAGAERQEPPTGRSLAWMGTAAVLLLLVLAVVFVARSTPNPEPTPPSSTGLEGALVYATQESFGWSRLHVMDLVTGSVAPGPQVFRPRRLLEVTTQTQGRIGAEVVFERSAQAGWVDLSSRERYTVDPLVSGAFVQWSPGGAEVFAASKGGRGDCGPVRIGRILTTGAVSRFASEPFCGTLEGLSIDDRSNSFITVRQPSKGEWSVWLVRGERGGFTRVVLPGYRLLSVSPAGELAVVRGRAGPGARVGAAPLEFFALGDDRPRKVGTPNARLLPERVLGWTRDDAAVFVLGRLGGARGVYVVPVRSDGTRPLPRLVLETPAQDVGMAQDRDGAAFFSAGGQFLVYQDGSLSSLDIPDETPRPVGPMLWLPALPYSEG